MYEFPSILLFFNRLIYFDLLEWKQMIKPKLIIVQLKAPKWTLSLIFSYFGVNYPNIFQFFLLHTNA
ncbi:hypothetical protein B7489_07210 [Vibrio alginolyticus]|nr:hypothetical protein B7489_07210 [Vibrio alginolyticus]